MTAVRGLSRRVAEGVALTPDLPRAVVRRNRSLRSGVVLLGALLALGVLGVLVLPDPNKTNLAAINEAPQLGSHLLGTDGIGRDVLSWTCAGVLVAVGVSVAVVLLATLLGVSIGLIAGYGGGWLDTVLMRTVDLQLALPPLLVFIAASAVLQPGPVVFVCLLASVGWLPYARVARNVAVAERERGYVAAARLAGSSRRRILGVHLLGASATPVIVLSSLQAGYVILWESGLSFLGLGIRPPLNSLGFLINSGREAMAEAPWVVVVPGLAVGLLVLSANLIGDGLRDALQRDEEVTEA